MPLTYIGHGRLPVLYFLVVDIEVATTSAERDLADATHLVGLPSYFIPVANTTSFLSFYVAWIDDYRCVFAAMLQSRRRVNETGPFLDGRHWSSSSRGRVIGSLFVGFG